MLNIAISWQTVPDSSAITIKQNVGFKVGIVCPEKFQLNLIQNG